MQNSKAELHKSKQKKKLNLFEMVIETFGGLQIALSPFLIAVIIGFVIYLSKPDKYGFIIAISIAVTGLAVGIIWGGKNLEKERNG
ncbi:hypothetical protein BH11BAC6_BH11BAC6_00340 [soil metagenome]